MCVCERESVWLGEEVSTVEAAVIGNLEGFTAGARLESLWTAQGHGIHRGQAHE